MYIKKSRKIEYDWKINSTTSDYWSGTTTPVILLDKEKSFSHGAMVHCCTEQKGNKNSKNN